MQSTNRQGGFAMGGLAGWVREWVRGGGEKG